MTSICATCGGPYEVDSRTTAECPACRPPDQQPWTARGEAAADYDWTWRKLSQRARRIQPFCSDCNTTDDLTCDHTPEAWKRYEQGKKIRLQDVDVVCRSCNAERGRARGDEPTWKPLRRQDLPDLDALDADDSTGPATLR